MVGQGEMTLNGKGLRAGSTEMMARVRFILDTRKKILYCEGGEELEQAAQ